MDPNNQINSMVLIFCGLNSESLLYIRILLLYVAKLFVYFHDCSIDCSIAKLTNQINMEMFQYRLEFYFLTLVLLNLDTFSFCEQCKYVNFVIKYVNLYPQAGSSNLIG